jgi:hypothetical protein
VQLIPAGVEVIVPWPLLPGMIAIVPVAPVPGHVPPAYSR